MVWLSTNSATNITYKISINELAQQFDPHSLYYIYNRRAGANASQAVQAKAESKEDNFDKIYQQGPQIFTLFRRVRESIQNEPAVVLASDFKLINL